MNPRAVNPLPAARWQRLDGLLDEALERDPDARTAYLRAACGDDPALYAEAVALLRHAEEGPQALGESATAFAAPLLADGGEAPPADLAPSTRVGPYRVEGELGRGGMGVVYRATRADGAFDKAVALKLVKRGMDTDEVLARFHRERRLLAGLDHPAVARLLDGGAAEDGRPFLVMELVEGEPITRYCDRRVLDVDARLALFRRVCEAVEHAHHRLVVHRDLKPSNVLVTEGAPGKPQVKLLDFGIAKLLGEGDDDVVTRTGARRLTPAYAAPEQQRGEAVTTATDVYALGVLLYELLTGRRPDEAHRPPSGAVTAEAAAARATTPERLRRRLKGDLDTIVGTALREESDARYRSAEALLADLRRHRQGLPVQARPASVGYQLRKFVLRHRASVAAAGAFVLMLVVGVVALAWQQRQTAHERDRAEDAAQQALETTRFLAGLFDEGNPESTGGQELSAREVLERGAARLDGELVAEPELRGRLLYIVGDVFARMEQPEASLRYCEEAYALQDSLFGPVHPDAANTLFCLASAHFELGERAEADSLFAAYEAVLSVLPEETTPEHARRLQFMGRLLYYRGELDRSLAYHQRAHAIYRTLYGLEDERSIMTGVEVSRSLNAMGRHAEAEAWVRIVLAAVDRLPESEEDKLRLRASVVFTLGQVDEARGQRTEAADAYREALELKARVDSDDPSLTSWMLDYGRVLSELGRYAEAESVLRDATARFEAQMGQGAFYAMHAQRLQGEAVRDQGRFTEAEALLTEAFERMRAERGEADSFTQGAVEALVTLYERWGRPDRAAAYRALVVEEAPGANAARSPHS